MAKACFQPLCYDQVTTVDRYQGQQNDYIILSLVRTKTVGHIRDVRRLVVAMSRARLGLYVLARVSLFQNCFELRPAFSQVKNTKQNDEPSREPLLCLLSRSISFYLALTSGHHFLLLPNLFSTSVVY